MAKKRSQKLIVHKNYVVTVQFKKHSIRITLTSERGVLIWKTSRSENFLKRARVTRQTAQFMGQLMGIEMRSLKVKTCEVAFKGPARKSFSRGLLFSLLKHGKFLISKISTLGNIAFGGTKFPKRARK